MDIINSKGEVVRSYDELKKLDGSGNHWDKAYELLNEKSSIEELDFFEPEVDTDFESESDSPIRVYEKAASAREYLKEWPPYERDIENNILWHLDDAHSELACALKKVEKKILLKDRVIKIAVIDTGYLEDFKPPVRNWGEGKSFKKGEDGKRAIDRKRGVPFEQQGHGNAVMTLLAGGKVENLKIGSKDSYTGNLGAIPFAEIIPIRIGDSVARFGGMAFVKAVKYAIDDLECDVISMSMAGAPMKQWAKVVNDAYDKGIIMVTAAGNHFTRGAGIILPKKILYPARWERVIAATGATYNHIPYNKDAKEYHKHKRLEGFESEYQQGNYGSKSVMKTALAAYTPNVLWANKVNKEGHVYGLKGGGTSSATPQIAAAAALYLVYHREDISKQMERTPEDKWRIVEMVKEALFETADSTYKKSKKFYGNGILKANKALDYEVTRKKWDKLKKAKKAKASGFLLDFFKTFFGISLLSKSKFKQKKDERYIEMLSVEVWQAIHTDDKLHEFLELDEESKLNEEEFEKLKKKLLSSNKVSDELKKVLQGFE